MDAWKKTVLSARKTHVHKIPRFRGGGYFGFWGGGSADFILMGALIFLIVVVNRTNGFARTLFSLFPLVFSALGMVLVYRSCRERVSALRVSVPK